MATGFLIERNHIKQITSEQFSTTDTKEFLRSIQTEIENLKNVSPSSIIDCNCSTIYAIDNANRIVIQKQIVIFARNGSKKDG